MTGHQDLELDIDWGVVQGQLGALLPGDFKRLCEAFGEGEFSAYLYVHSTRGGDRLDVVEELNDLRATLATMLNRERAYEPYHLFEPGRGGLIPWARAVEEGVEFFWLAGDDDPAEWPVLARKDPAEEWHSFAMGVPEFIYHMLTDADFSPFGITELFPEPSYEMY
ncbi:hypothetical protein AT728_29270 [Streptomyces silvensis]|uniref:Knr4/Smi1-like domain-containing protein n=1 Tax=Streptomyces silvensis TaxID=1765722 RepID=A0A0W7WW21_9ACTN|nr:hypothetical protein AT728_29270 [Streptomyces silvensis]